MPRPGDDGAAEAADSGGIPAPAASGRIIFLNGTSSSGKSHRESTAPGFRRAVFPYACGCRPRNAFSQGGQCGGVAHVLRRTWMGSTGSRGHGCGWQQRRGGSRAERVMGSAGLPRALLPRK